MSCIRRFTVLATAAASACVLAVMVPASAQVGVTINGSAVGVSPPPIVESGRVFVPLRGVFEQLGASVVYDNGQINATGNGRDISLHIGSTNATVNGQPQTIDVAPFIIGESTYVPLRFISEALGASVDWDDADSTVAIDMAGAPSEDMSSNMSSPNDGFADTAPPPIPDYDQPPVPNQNEIWQPGYWQWGSNGYYWVPGTWVEPPQTGYLWTPGYWHARDNGYAWNPGYWAIAVGFYGGVNYGAGYFGHGYAGGRWSHDTFQYNTYVTHVNTTVVRNVYVDRNVVVNRSTHVGYNGGPHGVQDQPTAQQLGVAQSRHFAMTPVQQQHVQAAATDRRLLATVNHGKPPVVAVARPLTIVARPAGYVPVTEGHRVAPPPHVAPVAAPAPHAAPVAAPAYVAPAHHAERTAPIVRRAPAAAPAPVVAPAYHAERTAPGFRAAPGAAPAARAVPAAAPAYHAAPGTKAAPRPRPRDGPEGRR